jgi:hypothetical protein
MFVYNYLFGRFVFMILGIMKFSIFQINSVKTVLVYFDSENCEKLIKMRITTVLHKQHLGFMTKRTWHLVKNRKIRDSGVKASLEEKGIKVTSPFEFLTKPKEQ